MRVVASDHAQRRLAGLILFRPHQVAAARRPRTEARPRRKDPRKWKHGIDKPRPVTEARIERSEMRDQRPGCRYAPAGLHAPRNEAGLRQQLQLAADRDFRRRLVGGDDELELVALAL